MPPRRTNKQSFEQLAAIKQCFNKGELLAPLPPKDGGLQTHPTIPVDRNKSEAEALAECLDVLHRAGCLASRNNVGMVIVPGRTEMYRAGIKDAGDIIGCFPDGRYFEVEVKRGRGGRISWGQLQRRRLVLDHGGIYLIAHSGEELQNLISEFVRKPGEFVL